MRTQIEQPVTAFTGAVGKPENTRGGKYLTFRLGEEYYGLAILKVREIIGLMDITRMPRTPEYIRGVINLRGKVIPVMGLRDRFGMQRIEDDEQTCIVVVDILLSGRSVLMGILVDGVSEVLDIQVDEIEDSPEFGAGVETEVILGIAKARERVIMLLDIDRVLSSEDHKLLENV
ncbi:chemotaxis protein CheW [bacterium]|nr:chemotaxis protein CheW [bacterium]